VRNFARQSRRLPRSASPCRSGFGGPVDELTNKTERLVIPTRHLPNTPALVIDDLGHLNNGCKLVLT
jgi:hypothetical protein